MCGRYSLEFDDGFYTRYKVSNNRSFNTSYNITPGRILPVIVSHSPNSMAFMVWGLIPFWEEKNEKPHGLINIRDDTIETKSWPHKYLETQRCLIPSTGFYEWRKTSDGKTPYYFHLKHKKYFSFAGIYSVYKDPKNGKEVDTYSIITTTPNSLMQRIHSRMPVILDEKDENEWLNPDQTDKEYLIRFFKPYPSDQMETYPISRYINNPAFDDVSLIKPVKDEKAQETMFPVVDSK